MENSKRCENLPSQQDQRLDQLFENESNYDEIMDTPSTVRQQETYCHLHIRGNTSLNADYHIYQRNNELEQQSPHYEEIDSVDHV